MAPLYNAWYQIATFEWPVSLHSALLLVGQTQKGVREQVLV